MKKKFLTQTHRRLNILTGEWILVSPSRLGRPWLGKVERTPSPTLPKYDPKCYLCPRNERANGKKNPDYKNTFAFDNDFSALDHDTSEFHIDENGLLRAESERGICRVVCFSPRHDLTLAEMSTKEIVNVIEVLRNEYVALAKLDDVNYIQIFENKGELMGCSNPHPHCQIWGEESIPVEPAKEAAQFEAYKSRTGKCILCEYASLESEEKDRVVFETESFIAVVPFWAIWPFEVLIVPKNHITNLTDITRVERENFAAALKNIVVRYDNLFEVPFPYSAGIHQAPTDRAHHNEWHFHMHFYPPLLRSASVKKFMVGYEMLANPQRDITAEAVTERLRKVPDIHYKIKSQKSIV